MLKKKFQSLSGGGEDGGKGKVSAAQDLSSTFTSALDTFQET